jgi:predicted ATP-grasp superfamily ATP-dependent carboligase
LASGALAPLEARDASWRRDGLPAKGARADGELKLIECNARFTAAQELLVRCGVDSARMVYDHLTGRPVTGVQTYRQGVLFWAPLRDFKAFRELQRAGELSLGGWLRSLLRPRTYPYLSLSDPLPFLDGTLGRLVRGK